MNVQLFVGCRTHSNIAAVWVLEVHHGSPVVGFVFDKAAGCACRQCREVVVWTHCQIKPREIKED